MGEKKSVTMDAASEELERRGRYLSSLIQRTKLKAEENQLNEAEAEAEAEAEGKKGEGIHQTKHHQQQKKGDDGAGDDPDEEQQSNVRVRAADMPPAQQQQAFRCANETLAAMPKLDSKRLALALKKEFDSSYGPAWHCIVGTSFGSYVTHSLGGFLYFSINKIYILLFRTAVEPLNH